MRVVALVCLTIAVACGDRCTPQADNKVICRCIDWTSKQSCAPLVLISSQRECAAVGGYWGHMNDGHVGTPFSGALFQSLAPMACSGSWMNRPTRAEAEHIYDVVIALREADSANRNSEVPPTQLHAAARHFLPFQSDPTEVRDLIVSPSFGPTSGGVWVQLVGAGSFHTPNSLQCKMDLIEQFCYSNHYMYTWCYVTPKCSGVYDMTCHNGPLQFRGKYAVVAKTPWVTSVYPFSGDTHGGSAVTVRGWNFEPHCPSQLLCRFGRDVVPAKYYTASSVMCIAPCGSKGFVSVEVSNDGGHHWSMSGVQFGYVGSDLSTAEAEAAECSRYLYTDHLSRSEN